MLDGEVLAERDIQKEGVGEGGIGRQRKYDERHD